MQRFRVECLRCGRDRSLAASRSGRVDAPECPRCGYLGWAPSAELTELVRKRLRERPPERRVDVFAH